MKRIIHILLLAFITCTATLAQKSSDGDATQKGKASYYSRKATGARMASGERLHHDSLVCAHKTHPFGTLLKVTNPSNKKEVIVRVADRGPHSRGRIIDLSYAAARELGMLLQGVCTVEVQVYHPEFRIPFLAPDYELPEMDFSITDADGIFDPTPAIKRKRLQPQTRKTAKQ